MLDSLHMKPSLAPPDMRDRGVADTVGSGDSSTRHDAMSEQVLDLMDFLLGEFAVPGCLSSRNGFVGTVLVPVPGFRDIPHVVSTSAELEMVNVDAPSCPTPTVTGMQDVPFAGVAVGDSPYSTSRRHNFWAEVDVSTPLETFEVDALVGRGDSGSIQDFSSATGSGATPKRVSMSEVSQVVSLAPTLGVDQLVTIFDRTSRSHPSTITQIG